MPWQHILWDDEPGGNVDHVADNDLTPEDVNHVLRNPESHGVSRSSGRPMAFGHAPDGRRIAVVYEDVDGVTFVPVTAYEMD